jgi:hypothetical protein
MVANGFVASVYRHRTSRAGDPHLHWHTLVANIAQGVDGRWSALDGTAIYNTSRTGADTLEHTRAALSPPDGWSGRRPFTRHFVGRSRGDTATTAAIGAVRHALRAR